MDSPTTSRLETFHTRRRSIKPTPVMAKSPLALMVVVSVLLHHVYSAGDIPLLGSGNQDVCINGTVYHLSIDAEGRVSGPTAIRCPQGQVCDPTGAGKCVPTVVKAVVGPFQCRGPGKFSDPDPCSSAFYLCIDTVFAGLHKVNLTCGPTFSYNDSLLRCIPQPALCRSPVVPPAPIPAPAEEDAGEFVCPGLGRFPVLGSCNEYHVCYRFFWSVRHSQYTCSGSLEYNSIKRKCVPRWYSDCGLDRYNLPWRGMYFGKALDESSEEDDISDDKMKKMMKKLDKKMGN